MMSRAWSEKNGVERAQDFNGKQETFAVRNANGTGPVPARALRARRAHHAAGAIRDGGAGPTSATATSTEVSFAAIQAGRDAAGGAGLRRGRPVLDPPFPRTSRA